MRKLLALCLVATLASSSFAYVPLSNSQTDLGSFRNGATRGMFYEEIDVLSASPVDLMDFGGTNLYTNWGNLRYSNDPTGVATIGTPGASAGNVGADRALTYDATGRSQVFNMGIIGNPLSWLGVDNSRAGVVFQNYGSKATLKDLDKNPGNGNESTGKWSTETLSIDQGNGITTIDRTQTTNSDVKYYDNSTYTKWDAGIAYKGLILSDLVAGFSISKNSNVNKRITGGSKSYNEVYQSSTGVNAGCTGLVANSGVGDSYNVGFAEADYDRNSENVTDLLFQGRYPIFGLQVQAGLGVRVQSNSNADSVDSADAVTVTGREDKPLTVAGTVGQYWNTGTSIKSRIAASGNGLDFSNTTFGATILGDVTTATQLFASNNGNDAGIVTVNDERKGTGPILRLEAMKEWSKANLTGIFNYSSVKQDVGKEVVSREYVQTSYASLLAGAVVYDNFIAMDYTKNQKENGDRQIKKMDMGGKIEMKALEGMKLAFGGFIANTSDIKDVSKPVSDVGGITYADGDAANQATNSIAAGGIPTRGANGEGSYSATTSRTDHSTTETLTTEYIIPVGAEIKLAQKWTLGVGTRYCMNKTATKQSDTTGRKLTTTVSTPADTAVAANTTYAWTAASHEEHTTYTESHNVQYTYGVRYDVNRNLSLSCNAFLDTAANGNTAGNVSRATIFDLDTYRLLAIQAVFHF